MNQRIGACFAAAASLFLLAVPASHAPARALTPKPGPCGMPAPAGALAAPPQIDVGALPRDDRGRHELILRVRRDRDRFCFAYTNDGVQQSVAPVIRVHRGERFALRMVNELSGPAKGGALPASAILPCKPPVMPAMMPRNFAGYMNHTIHAAQMNARDVDVNIHLHGFEGPALQENVFLSTLSTPMHACEFDITIPQSQPPGTYFYHPHAHGMSDDEVAGGLSGMWIVEPDTPQIAPANEHVIIEQYRVPYVDNYRFMPGVLPLEIASTIHEAQRRPLPAVSFNAFDPPAWPSTLAIRAGNATVRDACGIRTGLQYVVNGEATPARLTVPAGEPQLLRVLNATSDSFEFYHLRDAQGRVQDLHVVGRDGIPVGGNAVQPLAQYVALREAPLVPSGRMDVLLTLKPGDVLTLYSDHHCIAPWDEFHLNHDLLTIAAGPPAVNPTQIASEPLQPRDSPAAQLVAFAHAHPASVRRRAITYTEYALPNANGRGGHAEFYITETSARDFHEHPYSPVYAKGATAPQPDIVVKHGTIEEWYLFNATMEEHTFHIHQMAFVNEDAKPGPETVDTVMIPFGKILPNKADPAYPLVKPSVTHVLLDFRNVPRGTFVFHCHMLFHEDHGMMAVVKVE